MPINGRKNRLNLTLSRNTPRMPTELSIRPLPQFISLRQSRLYTTQSRQKCPSAGAINASCGSEATLSTSQKVEDDRLILVCDVGDGRW
jgi:hypothetical protein